MQTSEKNRGKNLETAEQGTKRIIAKLGYQWQYG